MPLPTYRTLELMTTFATPGELATALRCSKSTIYRAIDRGELPAVRLGQSGAFRIRPEAVEEFVRPARAAGETTEQR